MKRCLKNIANEHIEKLPLLLKNITFVSDVMNYYRTASADLYLKDLDTRFKNISIGITNEISSLTSDLLSSLKSSGNNESELVETPGEVFDTFELIINGYASLSISSVGVVANIIGIFFISIGRKRGTLFNLLLTGAFLSDVVFLSLDVLRCINLFVIPIPESYLWSYHIALQSGIRCSMASSVLFLVAIARARLVAITQPFQVSAIGASTGKTRNRFLEYCVPISLISISIASMVYWETNKEICHMENGNTTIIPVPSFLRLNPIYSIFYVGFINVGLLGAFPLISLIYCSYNLIHESKKQTDSLRTSCPKLVLIRDMQRQKLTHSLVSIIFAFIALHSFRIFNSFGEFILLIISYKNQNGFIYDIGTPALFFYTTSLSELFITIYASINVMIYLYPNVSKYMTSFLPASRPTSDLVYRRRCAFTPETLRKNNIETEDTPIKRPSIELFTVEQPLADNSGYRKIDKQMHKRYSVSAETLRTASRNEDMLTEKGANYKIPTRQSFKEKQAADNNLYHEYEIPMHTLYDPNVIPLGGQERLI